MQVWLVMVIFMLSLQFRPVRSLLARLLPPGSGPSREVRERSSFVVRAAAVSKPKVP